jgi:hypothetical protein
MAELSITDQFVFLALAAAPDGWPLDALGQAIAPRGTSAAVAAARLADLAVLGPSDQPLEAGIRRLARDRPELAALDQLRATGLVNNYARPVGRRGRRTVPHVWARDDGSEASMLDRLRAIVMAEPPERGRPQDRLLLSVMYASGLTRRWFRGPTGPEFHRRVDLRLGEGGIEADLAAALRKALPWRRAIVWDN